MTITFNCFITCLLESYQDHLFVSLVKMGYTIGQPVFLKPDVKTNHPNQPSAVLAINVHTLDENVTSDLLLRQIKSIFDERKLYYYSVVVFGAKHIAWQGSNIFFTNNQEVPQLPPSPTNSKLN